MFVLITTTYYYSQQNQQPSDIVTKKGFLLLLVPSVVVHRSAKTIIYFFPNNSKQQRKKKRDQKRKSQHFPPPKLIKIFSKIATATTARAQISHKRLFDDVVRSTVLFKMERFSNEYGYVVSTFKRRKEFYRCKYKCIVLTLVCF